MSKISVIIPAYNAEKYIEKCIYSVLNQTYDDFEIIIVDDGSKDNTLAIAKMFEKKDDRVRCFHQENKGQSSARNLGLLEKKGNYVFFLDSDDWIDENCFERIMEVIIEKNADILFFAYYKEYEQKKEVNVVYNSTKNFDNEKESEFSIFDMRLITPWGKIYKTSVINDIKFDEEMKIAEDVDFNFRVYANVKKAIYLPECLMHYRILDKSAVHGFDPKIIEKFKYPIETIRKNMLSKNIVEKKAYYSFAAISYFVIIQNGIFLDDSLNFKQKIKALKLLRKNKWVQELLKNTKYTELPTTRKLVLLFAKIGFNIAVLFSIKIKRFMETQK